MRRRSFIALAAGAGAAWPLGVSRAQPALPVIGFLGSRASGEDPQLLTSFRLGLKQGGYVEGQNVLIEYRFAENQYDRLPALAAELVQRRVAIIAANGPAAQAAKAATSTIPIVFTAGYDPVEVGLVASLNRPGGNVTGASILDVELGPKRIELLREMVPQSTVVAILVNPTDPVRARNVATAVQVAARSLGLEANVVQASREADFDAMFASLLRMHADGLVIGGDPFFNSRSAQLGALTARHKVPTIFQFREFTAGGGLASYGVSLPDSYRQVGVYAARILSGEKPADLPIVQASKFELTINFKTAKALALAVPSSLLARADEVIE